VNHTIYTIGHSNHSLDEFLELLAAHSIEVVADVRSQPYGRLEHFHREALSAALRAHSIDYLFMGNELGGRPAGGQGRSEGAADFQKIAATPKFRQGIERLLREAAQRRTAIMCAEKEPIDCHRMLLVSRELKRAGCSIKHILADGSLEDQADTEKRMVAATGVQRTLFEPDLSDDELVERAYEKRSKLVAHQDSTQEAADGT